jgi:hypothetical protein
MISVGDIALRSVTEERVDQLNLRLRIDLLDQTFILGQEQGAFVTRFLMERGCADTK